MKFHACGAVSSKYMVTAKAKRRATRAATKGDNGSDKEKKKKGGVCCVYVYRFFIGYIFTQRNTISHALFPNMCIQNFYFSNALRHKSFKQIVSGFL